MSPKQVGPAALRALRIFSVLLACALPACAGTNPTIIVTQVYGAGGNSGASLNQDYVELFNAGTAPVTMNGWALQYRSATGTGAFTPKPLATATIQPGHYYLVAASTAGTTGSALPTVDDTAALSLGGTAGIIALTNTSTALASCAAISTSNTVDLVGYGSTATCFEGTGPTGTLTVTTAAIRSNICVDADSNSAEFTVATANPRNSATTASPCSTAASPISATVTATPTSQYATGAVTFSVAVTPGANPASTGITVTADLSPIGGSSTQTLYDDKTHGDAVAGDYNYTLATTVGSSASVGAKTITVTVKDQSTTVTPTVAFNVIVTPVITAIHTIQTNAPNSTYVGQSVTTSGIITGVLSNGFYIEAKDAAWDSDDATSEGIFIHTGTGSVPSNAVVGTEMQLTGTVSTFPTTGTVSPGTEIDSPTGYSVLSTGNALPSPRTLTAADDSPSGMFTQWARFQSMRVTIPSFTTTSPTDGTLTESTSNVVSGGNFYGIVTGVARPFREPGLSVQDAVPTGAPATIQRWDGNPELIFVRSTTFGSAIDVTANVVLTGMSGIMDLANIDSSVNPNRSVQLLLQTPPTVPTLPTYVAVPARASNEFTVGTQNVERFFSTTVGSAKLTTEAYGRRLTKTSLAIRNIMRTPDILCVEEMGTLDSLNDLSAKISADAIAAGQTDPHYQAYLYTGSDVINNGFLINPSRVTIISVDQVGKTATYTNSTGAAATMNDRPPLVLHAGIKQDGNTANDYKVTVIINHLKALTDVATSANTPLKRRAQGEYLAALIKGYQANGERVVSVGDYNSFEFNDGYVDTIGIIEGTPVAASLVTLSPSSSYTPPNPALVDLVTNVPQAQRFSYVFGGSAQALDHIIVTPDLVSGSHLSPIRADAEFPLIYTNDGTRPESFSDHDGWVGYFPLPVITYTIAGSLAPTAGDFSSVATNASSTGQVFTITNTGNGALAINSITATGDFAQSNNCGASLAVTTTCSVNVVFTPTALGARSGTLTVSTNSTVTPTLTASLTGTGIVPPPTVTMTPATKAYGSVAVGASSAAQAFIVANSANAAATFAVAITGDFTQTNNCGTSIPANSSCTVNVTFTPTVLGNRSGSLTVTTSGSSAAIVSTLTGSGTAQASLSPASLTFASQSVGVTSAAQTLTVTNLGTRALGITSVTVTGDYAQTNTCGTSIAASGTCTVSVTFKATAGGTRTSTLTVTTASTVSGSLTASLTGTGTLPTDFAISPSSQSATMPAGFTANFNMLLTSQSGYAGQITLSCAGAPAGSTCTLSPTSVALASGGSIPVSAVIKTTTVSARNAPARSGGRAVSFAGFFGAILLLAAGRSRRAVRGAGLLMLALALILPAVGCGDAPTAGSTSAAGTYTYTVTATDGTNSHTATYVLTLN